MQETPVWFLGQENYWRRDRLPTPVFLGFPCDSDGKESTCNAGDLDSIPGLGRSPEEGKGYPFQYSGLENSMDCIVHGVSKSQTQLSDWTELIFHFWTRQLDFFITSVSLFFMFVCFSTFLNTWGTWVKHIYIISSVSSSASHFISSFLSLSTDWFFSWFLIFVFSQPQSIFRFQGFS